MVLDLPDPLHTGIEHYVLCRPTCARVVPLRRSVAATRDWFLVAIVWMIVDRA